MLNQREGLPFGNARVYISTACVEDGPTRMVVLTWRQRLCSWPWRPWVGTRTYTTKVPAIYRFDNGDLLMHPEIAAQLAIYQDSEDLTARLRKGIQ